MPSQKNFYSACLYLGGASGQRQLYVFDNDGSPANAWTAASDAAFVDASDNLMLTTCFYGTNSCTGDNTESLLTRLTDDPGGTVVDSHLELIQLNSAGGVCMVTQGVEERSMVGNAPHHFMIYHSLSAVPVYPQCGSRVFKLRISVKYVSGNPVKIDGDNAGDPVWTHAYAIESYSSNSADGTAPPVPNVIGLTEGDARSYLTASDYAVPNVSHKISTAPAGSVIDQYPSTVQVCPGSYCVPVGVIQAPNSGVLLTISSGNPTVPVTVPNLRGSSQSSATGAISALNLVPSVSYSKACIDPGEVLTQSPAAGTLAPPGSTVHITVDSGTFKTCVVK